jgi:hypothetical protein
VLPEPSAIRSEVSDMSSFGRIREVAIDASVVAVAVCAIIMATGTVWARFRPAAASIRQAPRPVSAAVGNWADLEQAGHRIGPASAKLTIVEFGDFECPACGEFEHTLQQVRRAYPKDVAVVFRHWPLPYHKLAYPAARAAECAADQGRFE